MITCENQELAPERQVVAHQVAEAAVDDLQDFLGEHCALRQAQFKVLGAKLGEGRVCLNLALVRGSTHLVP